MSKQWKINPFRILEKGWLKSYKIQSEKKRDATPENWQPDKTSPNANLPPIGNEFAIPLESEKNTK